MSGIEIVASIVGVASVGFRLSLILNAVSCDIANAPVEIHAISKSVTLFSLLLKQTGAVLEQAESVHSQEAIRTAEQVLEESNAVFNEINTMLDRVQTKKRDGSLSPSIPQRFKWCFKKHGIEYLLGRMDRLQMSLSLMLQIIQLGTTMASTSRNDPPERVREMSDKMKKERVEAQNVVVLYFFENQQLEKLYVAAREEQTEPQSPIGYRKDDTDSDALTLVSSHDSQLAKFEELQSYADKDLVIQPPAKVLSEFNDSWERMGRSPEDMVRSSEEVINGLLEKWTIWREKRDQNFRQSRSKRSSRYGPVVQDSPDEDDFLYSEKNREREDDQGPKYLEGVTTDWRQPHSGEARQKRAQLKKQYAAYQASLEGSSEIEESPGSTGSKKKPAMKHVIDSDEYTSESEEEKPAIKSHPRRRSSAVAVPNQPKPRIDSTPVSKSYGGSVSGPAQPSRASNTTPRPSLSPTWSQYQQHHRPFTAPDQNRAHHSISSPAPANHLHNGAYVYPPPGPQSPGMYHPTNPHNSQTYPFPQPQSSRHPPTRLGSQTSRQAQLPQPRPVSRDGPQRPLSRDGRTPRSPSRLSKEYTAAEYKEYEADKKRQKKEFRRNLGDGAAKGLLAGGGFAVLLEALDSL